MTEDTLKKWLSQVRKGSLELCILGLLAQRESYAFELIETLAQLDGFVVSEGAIYPLLKRLQSEGLLESFWSESDSGPPRKYYRLSERGRYLLSRMKREWLHFADFVGQILERSPEYVPQRSDLSAQTGKVPLPMQEAPAPPARD